VLVLQGDLVRLRSFTEADREPFIEMADDEAMFRYMKFRLTREDAENKYWPWLLEQPHLGPRPTYNFVVEGADGFAGWAAIGPIRAAEDSEFGWYLRSDQWGRGYATEATRLLLEYGFTTLDRLGVYATADPENVASVRVLEKSGLTNQGHATPVTTWRGERPRLLFIMTKDRWLSMRR
jgi:[ribosomal protein S5]-alanine N-acetyltransferase